MKRILVVGGRSMCDWSLVAATLDGTRAALNGVRVFHGGDSVAGELALLWASLRGAKRHKVTDPWEHSIDLVIAFGGECRDDVEEAGRRGVTVINARGFSV